MAYSLTSEETRLLKKALGLDVPKKVTPKRNRLAAHLTGPTLPILRSLEDRDLTIEDPANHYGKMRVYRVTTEGFAALGLKKPRPELTFEPMKREQKDFPLAA